jgi:hypothetical protein
MAYKVLMVGLSLVLKVDDYLIDDNEPYVFLCDEYRAKSIVRFCLENKFLDEV